MCGIAGFLCNESMHADNMQQIVGRMTNSLDHRGPDATGIWSDNELTNTDQVLYFEIIYN